MKRNTMFALIALGLGGASVAHANDWYLAPRIGADFADQFSWKLSAGCGNLRLAGGSISRRP